MNLSESVIDVLTSLRFIGQVHPTYRNSIDPKIIALLVPINSALDEARSVDPDLTRTQLLKILKEKNIYVFNSIDDFVKLKEKIKVKTIPNKLIKEFKTRLEEIADSIDISKQKIRYNHELDQVVIEGKNGYLYTDGPWWYISVVAKSKRQWSSYKKQLKFMELINDGDQEGRFRSQSPTMPEEAKIIRKIVGFKKKPQLHSGLYKSDRPSATNEGVSGTFTPDNKGVS